MKTIQLNKEVLLNLYGGCVESKSQVFAEFLSSYSSVKQSLFAAYESGDIDSLKKLLHHHGPSFLYLGAPEVSSYFQKLETRCNIVQHHLEVSNDFFTLLQMIDDTWLQVVNQMHYYKKAV